MNELIYGFFDTTMFAICCHFPRQIKIRWN